MKKTMTILLALVAGWVSAGLARQDTLRLTASLDSLAGDTIENAAVMYRVEGSFVAPWDSTDTLEAGELIYRWVLDHGAGPETLTADTASQIRLYPLEDGNYLLHAEMAVALSDSDTVVVLPETSAFTIRTTRRVFTAQTWHMVSLPRRTTTVQPSSFCGTDRFLCYHWVEGSGDEEGNYLNYADQTLERGAASWIKSENADTVTLGAGSAYSADTFHIFLEEGWNQIANPYGFNVLWNDAIFYISGSTPVSVGQSRQEDRPKGVWEWDPATSGYVYLNPQVQLAVMRPWSGYWVYASRAVTIYFPGQPYFTMDTAAGAPRAAQPLDGWRVRIGVTQGTVVDQYNYFGTMANASDAIGPEDTYKPPALFTHLTLDLGDGLCEDFRSRSNFITWRATLAHPAAGTATVTWQNAPALPAAGRLYLYDAEAETWTDMRATDAYTLAVKSAARDRILTIVATTRSDFAPQRVSAALRVVAVTPHPFTHGAEFRCTVPVDAWPQPATLEIFSLDGAPVRALRTTDASYTVTWDGTSSAGAALPAGIYTYRLTVGRYTVGGKLMKIE